MSCAAVKDADEVQSPWTTVFRDNAKWQGTYDYDGRSVTFAVDVHSASDDVVKATLRDRITQLELTGLYIASARMSAHNHSSLSEARTIISYSPASGRQIKQNTIKYRLKEKRIT